jgi:hypothetical protein
MIRATANRGPFSASAQNFDKHAKLHVCSRVCRVLILDIDITIIDLIFDVPPQPPPPTCFTSTCGA